MQTLLHATAVTVTKLSIYIKHRSTFTFIHIRS